MPSHKYEITPLTYQEFVDKYHTVSSFAYRRYLLTNRDNHHYNDVCIREWFNEQLKTNLIITDIDTLRTVPNNIGYHHMEVNFNDGEECSTKMIFTIIKDCIKFQRTLHSFKAGTDTISNDSKYGIRMYGNNYKFYIVLPSIKN